MSKYETGRGRTNYLHAQDGRDARGIATLKGKPGLFVPATLIGAR
jgi:hypothetical protein